MDKTAGPTVLYDTHAHVFSSEVTRYPIDTAGAREGAAELAARIVSDPITTERLLPAWSESGVYGGCLVQYSSAYKYDNRYILDCAAAHPGRLAPIVILDATDPASSALLSRLVRERGVTGLRLSGRLGDGESWLDSEAALNVWRAAAKLGIAMVLMYLPPACNADTLARIGALARRFPEMSVVLDHIGWPLPEGAPDHGLSAVARALAPLRNVAFKITTVNFDRLAEAGKPAAPFLRRAVDMLGVERLMWGSDFGNTRGMMHDMVQCVLSAAESLTEAERRAVLHDNGRACFAAEWTG